MRPVRAVMIGLLGLGLVAPAAAQASDEDTPCPKCESGEGHGIFHRIKHKHVHTQANHVCARCMKKIEAMGPPVEGMVAGGPVMCSSCQAAMASAKAPLILEKGETIVVEGAPGMAVVDTQGQPAMGQTGAGPVEPEPIGVMRTAYSDVAAMKPAAGASATVAVEPAGYAAVGDVKHDAAWRKKKGKARAVRRSRIGPAGHNASVVAPLPAADRRHPRGPSRTSEIGTRPDPFRRQGAGRDFDPGQGGLWTLTTAARRTRSADEKKRPRGRSLVPTRFGAGAGLVSRTCANSRDSLQTNPDAGRWGMSKPRRVPQADNRAKGPAAP